MADTDTRLGAVAAEATADDELSYRSQETWNNLHVLEKTESRNNGHSRIHSHIWSRSGSRSQNRSQNRRRGASRASGVTHASDDTDPLEPLELAWSPGYENASPGFDHIDEEYDRGAIAHVRTTTSIGSSASRPPDFEVIFEENDPINPRCWPRWYRGWVIFCISYTTWVVVFYSTSYTASIPGLMEQFHVTSTPVATLGVTSYLLGLATGSLVVAPLSELWGRRPVYIACMAVFTILVIPCCLATSLTEIIVVRFFGAVFGSVMVTNSAGSVVDISTEETRALVMSIWSIAPINGPVTGPVIGGFVYQYLGWRWDNWLVLILAAVATICVASAKETYGPMVLQAKAARLREETDDDRWWTRYDMKLSKLQLLKINLVRPFVLSFTEPILWFFNLWISLIYGILYLCFVAYPIVFSQHRGWGPGVSGLAFVGIGIGSMIAICAEPLWRKLINKHPKDPTTGRVPPEATARVMIIGAILVPVGQLSFSWTCLPTTIHWAIPIAFGIPFGCGNTLCFIYGSNYLAGAYGIYAASALAGNAVTRSLFGGTLPLAGPSMYARLTPQWAGTMLGLLELLMVPIPIIFYKYGERIRAKSPVIRQMREDAEKNEQRLAKNQRRKERQAEAALTEGLANSPPGVAVESDVEKNAGREMLPATRKG
ncbi:major facilitator superfamily transporter [Pseudomassariella vexata]|uniref:Major facilitator superfamily transporter n=1 Tax=Pseudomassariella vexata TaxID=1141098 RepID=A0A1Y2DI61_9PEZI|nr:major facilitator superfamily transporter [Pseudomassariella vexata]ORY58923.1 major facilitator superfamily transporter [Pseudomassariella vexata]